MADPMLQRAITALDDACRYLALARREYPAKGDCAIRAVIDVSQQEIAASRRHLNAAALAQDTPNG